MPKIAVIEDDTDLLALLRHRLEQAGYAVAARETGDGAVEFLRQNKPDMVLLDVMLPEQDGPDQGRSDRTQPHAIYRANQRQPGGADCHRVPLA